MGAMQMMMMRPALAGVLTLCSACATDHRPPAPTAGIQVPLAREETAAPASPSQPRDIQEERWALIEKCLALGIFSKVNCTTDIARIWVRPAFYAMDYDDKVGFVEVVLAYYVTEDPGVRGVFLFDARSGKEVGRYGAISGLKMD